MVSALIAPPIRDSVMAALEVLVLSVRVRVLLPEQSI